MSGSGYSCPVAAGVVLGIILTVIGFIWMLRHMPPAK